MRSFFEFMEEMVSVGDISRQLQQTVSHLLPGSWRVYREEKPQNYGIGQRYESGEGGVLMLGRDVKQSGDQYLAIFRWTLYDEDAKKSGVYKPVARSEYDSVRGSAHVSFTYAVMGYRPGDVGSSGGDARYSALDNTTEGLPMNSIRAQKMGFSGLAETPYEAVKSVGEIIDYYDLGYFKRGETSVSVQSDYYEIGD